MRAAAVTIDITPPADIAIAGNIREDNLAKGAHDPILCNALLLDSYGERILLLSLDWLGIEKDDADALRLAAGRAVGLDASHVMVAASHTHSGPNIITQFGFHDRTPQEKEYLQGAIAKISEKVAEANTKMQPVSAWRASRDVTGLSFNRRLRLADGSIRMNWNQTDPDDVIGTTGPVDPALTVLGLQCEDGTWLAIVVHFTLHAAVLVGQDLLWSADYIGYMRQAVSAALTGAPATLFFNGAEGDVNHINYGDAHQLAGFEEAERIGKQLAAQVALAMQNASVMPDRLVCVSAGVLFSRRAIPAELFTWAQKKWIKCGGKIPSLLHGIPDECYARDIMIMAEMPGLQDELPMTALLIGDLAAVTLPGEVFCRIGLDIKMSSPFEHTVLIGLAQAYIGYIPDSKAFFEGGYEPRTGSDSFYSEDSCDMIAENALMLLEQIALKG